MFVYFLKTEASPPLVKIGKARSPLHRVSVLQTGCPYELRLLGTVACRSDADALSMEHLMHSKLWGFRVRGEWFAYTDAVAAIIRDVIERPDSVGWFNFKGNLCSERVRRAADAQRDLDTEFRAIVN